MRLTLRTNRGAQAAILAAWAISSGCQRLPYIDQSKSVPHDPMGATALEDKEVKQADFLSSSLNMQMPKVHKPRTTNDPEAEEVWPMTLQEAIRIGLDNSEIVRVIPFWRPGHSDWWIRAIPSEHRCRRRCRRCVGCRFIGIGLRPGHPGNVRSPRHCRFLTPLLRPT